MSEPVAAPFAEPRGATGRALLAVSRGFALAGGALLLAMILMSAASVAGRALFSSPIVGDFELVQIGCAIAVASFLPYCQMRRGHVIVDFFTARMKPRARAALDAFGALLLGASAALVTWRMVAGAVSLKEAGESSMLLGIPIWYAYVAMLPVFALLAATALYTAYSHLAEPR
jgi:TRAP-type C4-dicarboxylate transport system permease small subunit